MIRKKKSSEDSSPILTINLIYIFDIPLTCTYNAIACKITRSCMIFRFLHHSLFILFSTAQMCNISPVAQRYVNFSTLSSSSHKRKSVSALSYSGSHTLIFFTIPNSCFSISASICSNIHFQLIIWEHNILIFREINNQNRERNSAYTPSQKKTSLNTQNISPYMKRF